MKIKIYQKLVDLLPREILYFAFIRVYAIVTTEKYTNRTPDSLTFSEICRFLESKPNQ